MIEFIKENAAVDVFRKMEVYVHEYYTEPENFIQPDKDEVDDEEETLEDYKEELNIEERGGVIEKGEETVNNEEDIIIIDSLE